VGPTHVDVTEGGKKLRRGARLWTIAVATFKSESYRFLRLSGPTDEEIAAGASYAAGYVRGAREESDVSTNRSGAAMYPAFECSRSGCWP
jgi:hypothetical protein